jgi:hypothetical protein
VTAAPADEAAIAKALLALLARRGVGKTLDPAEVARAVAGDHPDAWGRQMPAVRRVAVALMKQGRLVILRKGRPVDPDDFRGVYRLAAVGDGTDQSEAAGKSSSV